ncbi:MAG: hypothetical protein H6508_00140 [Calditrichaeota bacterium]|nr:hypothetical protein [Calditrichota bacterium]
MKRATQNSTLTPRSLTVQVAAFLVVLGLHLSGSAVLADEYDIKLSLRYPAGETGAPQPTCLYVDRFTGDVYLTDASTSRVAIYDAQRRFEFEFSTQGQIVSPRQVAVDSLGRIFVIGESRQHTIGVFDYNGEFLRYIDVTENEKVVGAAGVALSGEGNLVVLLGEPLRVVLCDPEGDVLDRFVILEEGDETTRTSPILGNLLIDQDRMILPVPLVGQVAVMDMQGKLIRFLGHGGGGPSELSFPAACCPTDDGGYVVVDKHRHLLQFLDSNGQYRYEVGGAGWVEGWFFHPTALAKCQDGTLLVGQIYANRVQAVTPQIAPVVTGS